MFSKELKVNLLKNRISRLEIKPIVNARLIAKAKRRLKMLEAAL